MSTVSLAFEKGETYTFHLVNGVKVKGKIESITPQAVTMINAGREDIIIIQNVETATGERATPVGRVWSEIRERVQ